MHGLLSRWDHEFADYMEQSTRNCTYLSSRDQNDLIHSMAAVVTNRMVNEINGAGMFSIMMDETTDVSRKEQINYDTLC